MLVALQEIIAGLADAVTVQDPTGRLVFANAAAADLLGYDTPEALLAASPTEIVGRFHMLDEERRPVPLEQLPGRRAIMGEDPEPLVVRFRPAHGGPERWSRVKARPIFNDDGSVRLAINVIEDITDLKAAEHAQRFLSEAGKTLAASLDYERTLAAVAELAVPEIADWCVIDLKTATGFERVAAAHADPARLAMAEDVSRSYPPDQGASTGVPHVLRTGETELYEHITEEMLVAGARDEEHLRLLREIGFVSAMVVPMIAHDEVLGAITLVTSESARVLTADDRPLIEELARRTATAVENARLFRQRSEIAKTLQASLLPPALPEIEGVESAALFRAAGEGYEVGGDFYDVFSKEEGQWFAVVGDVCGKGADAAAITALARYTVRAAAVQRRSPSQILRWLNESMLRQGTGPERFCTVAIARLDLRADVPRVTVASGGHPLPRVLRAGGTVQRAGAYGTLIGATPDIEVTDSVLDLEPGDTLVVFTDGLTEAGAPEKVWTPDDTDRAIAQAYRSANGSLTAFVEGIAAAALGELEAHPRDDVAILALQVG